MKVAKKPRIKTLSSLVCLILYAFSTINARPCNVMQPPKDSLIFPVISEMFRSDNPMYGNEKHKYTFFDAAKLPVFCKIEHRIEQKSKIPFRFRLGNLNYVNMLENKE